MPDSKNIGVSASWMMCATVSSGETEAMIPGMTIGWLGRRRPRAYVTAGFADGQLR
jgi:hypothetical protein